MSPIKTLLAVGAVSLALAGLTAAPAIADPPPDGTSQVLAIAGSDTTEDVMDALVAEWNADEAATPGPDDLAFNIPVQANAADPAFHVPADPTCTSPAGGRDYVNKAVASPPTTWPAPNGSTDGRNALAGVGNARPGLPWDTTNPTTGCIDIARSSSTPSGSDPSTFEYYAFALDAVSWAAFPEGNAPDSLTIEQIRDIYNCTITDWDGLDATVPPTAPIQRYVPQDGSGTLNFWLTQVLGFDPRSFSNANCPPVIQIQEHDLTTIDTLAEKEKAISPFSVAQWIAQGNGTVTDKRSGAFLGKQTLGGVEQNPIQGSEPNLEPNPDVVFEDNPDFVGLRKVYNVIDTRQPNDDQALRMVGFVQSGPNAGPGWLCDPDNADLTGIMAAQGFSRLGDAGFPNHHCRVE